MPSLKNKLAEKIPALREELKNIVSEHAEKVISEVTIKQLFGGMRGVKGLICDTSLVDPQKGLIIRGRPIIELADKLPEEILFLLMTDELPTQEELKDLEGEFGKRSDVPTYVWDVLKAMPEDSHPMAMLDTAVLVMQKESVFAARYQEGMSKEEYWEPILEDFLNLIARLPSIAAYIYRLRFKKGDRIDPDPNLDLGANFARCLGLDDPNGEFTKLMQLYLTLHSDHEGGNVSAFTSYTVASALSDPYYAVSAGLNGLAGPLHGLANQECLRWVIMIKEKFGGVPTDEQLQDFAWETLNSGHVIPGYGHAVLRATDPRFTAFKKFGEQHCSDDTIFQTVIKLFNIIPNVLQQIEKISNPWPNVDAISGSLLYKYGLKEFSYYTVLFGVSRVLGFASQITLARALGMPIVRPKSVNTEWVKAQINQ